MIEVRQLTKRYGAINAIEDLTFDVRPGHVTGFLGPNGSGKSTTMRVMLGLDRPTSGTAHVDGVAYRSLPAPLRVVGAMLDSQAAHPGRTARRHLDLARRVQRDPARHGSGRCSASRGSSTWPIAGSASSRSGCDSDSASPVPCSATPGWSSSTSR